MSNLIAIFSICFAAALSCSDAAAGRDGGQILYQAQTLQRIKQAANTDVRDQTRQPVVAYWDSRRAPTQTW